MDRNALLAGAGLGALLMFIADPDRGARRRALVRDKMVRGARLGRRAVAATAADIANRTRGITAEARGALRRDQPEEAVLVERVRATLGRVCSHPGAIIVTAVDGEVTLRGDVLSWEAEAVLAAAGFVRGVEDVIDELERYERAENIPPLQGEGRVGEPSLNLLQREWAPATRALVGITAVAAAAIGVAAYARRAA
jgi:hypothetical protein